jgi:fibronectin type 3 domain-containing protein
LRAGAVLAASLAVAAFVGCSTETETPSFANPYDPVVGADLPTPDSLRVAVGDNLVRVSWGLPEGRSADEYAVFRKRTDEGSTENETLLGRVSVRSYTDAGVRNGRIYAYRIAAGVGGRFGPRSEVVEAQPGLYAMLIADDATYTRERDVTISYRVSSAGAIQLSEDPNSFTAPWRAATGSASWTLSPGDGTKTVYARFRLSDGSESLPVSDSIELDTRAVIESFDFDGSNVRSPGDAVHFRLRSDEPHGTATATVAGVFSASPLYDDGTNGDAVANNGVYEADLVIPPTSAILDQQAIGSFTDDAGNLAVNLTAPRLFTVQKPPDAVNLLVPTVAEPPDLPAVKLRWTESQDDAFSAYRIFRSESAVVDSTDRLVTTVAAVNSLTFDDTDVVEGTTYHYRVYVRNSLGLETGSNPVEITVPNERPPSAVTLRSPTATSTTRIALDWSASEALDFDAYRVYRNLTGAVDESQPRLAEIRDAATAFYDDAGLIENTVYYYRVYTVDRGGLSARSNEVEARTKNDPPPGVTLNAPAAIDTSSVTLSWAASTAHDFAFYRLYRDLIATVTTGSTLVVELDDTAFTSFHDTELTPGTRYYYRVFVVDDGPEAESAGSNTVMAETLETP